MIGNYVPRRCGIATFTSDLTTALNTHTNAECWALAMNDRPEGYAYPNEVRFEISQNEPGDYRLAADYLNIKSPDAVSLQHEYGIYGGESGSYIINLLKNLRMPVVSTLHTVLQEPNRDQRKVLLTIADLSSRLVVMSKKSRELLMSVYGVPEEKIRFVHHGIPDMPFVKSSVYKKRFGVQSKKVILTFGLLSPNKGIEVMINALPAIVEKNPDAVYIVVGATHPHVKLHSGEEYRQGLERLARKLGVEKNIIFYNRFVEFTELCDFLGATDVYVTPYLHAAQAVSGTLAYAMGAGKPVVSTPYWYAEEMLAEDRGVLVDFHDSKALSDSVNRLLGDDKLRNGIVKKAWDFSRGALWKNVASDYLGIFDEIRTERQEQPRVWTFPEPLEKDQTSIPDINLGHLFTMTDDTGMLQHATYSVPEYAHGYCIDDNARALIVSVMAALQSPEPKPLITLQRKYLSFIQHAFNEKTGYFRNFMGFDRRWLEDKGSEDSQGRTIWALGVCSALSKDKGCTALATRLFHQALPLLEKLTYPRSIAFSLVGIHAYLARFSGDTEVRRVRGMLADRLFNFFPEQIDDDWPWFEDSLCYANAKIPQALLLSGQWEIRPELTELGLKILDWLIDLQIENNHYSAIGNDGWFVRGGTKPRFDQQPIEAQAMLEACLLAFRMTLRDKYRNAAQAALNWFLGQNDLNEPLYDYATGGCRDGLTPDGPNLNQGAESTLAWLLSALAMHGFHAEQGRIHYTETIEE